MPKITIQMPDGEDLKFGLDLDKITIGRAEGNDIVINDGSVSSKHAEMVAEHGNYRVTDLDSTNGTRVNGEKITDAFLENGTLIKFGHIDAEYESDVDRGEKVELPEEKRDEAEVGASAVRPTNYSNDQPFAAKKKKSDPVAGLLITIAILAILACLAAAFFATQMNGGA